MYRHRDKQRYKQNPSQLLLSGDKVIIMRLAPGQRGEVGKLYADVPGACFST